jgi:uncharacterized protein YjiS (DUF1127 family)
MTTAALTLPLRWSAAPFARIARALATWRERRLLAALPPERLADMGLGEAEVRLGLDRPLWNVPSHWLR